MKRITARLSDEDLAWLDGQVELKRARGLKSDRSDQLRVAIAHRRLALMPEAERLRVLAQLGCIPEGYELAKQEVDEE